MSEIEIQLLQSFCEGVPVGVCLIDLDGKIVHWNPAAESITGYLGSEVLGRIYRGDMLVHPSGTPGSVTSQCPLIDVLKEGKPVESDLYLLHRLGHRIAVHINAFALRNAMGELEGAGEIFTVQEGSAWTGHSDHEFEIATGLAAVEATKADVEKLLLSRSATSSAIILIGIEKLDALLRHGGSGMLHQAIRVLAKTVSGLMPPGHRVGCWSDWRLVALAPDCTPEKLNELKRSLNDIGSSCAVKWWGDRVKIAIRAVACYGDPSQNVDTLMAKLEQELAASSGRKG